MDMDGSAALRLFSPNCCQAIFCLGVLRWLVFVLLLRRHGDVIFMILSSHVILSRPLQGDRYGHGSGSRVGGGALPDQVGRFLHPIRGGWV